MVFKIVSIRLHVILTVSINRQAPSSGYVFPYCPRSPGISHRSFHRVGEKNVSQYLSVPSIAYRTNCYRFPGGTPDRSSCNPPVQLEMKAPPTNPHVTVFEPGDLLMHRFLTENIPFFSTIHTFPHVQPHSPRSSGRSPGWRG